MLIKLIRELTNALKSGGHSGKGNKYYSKGDYDNALHHYELAAQHHEISLAGPNPALLEYLSMTHAQLGNIEEALTLAERSHNLYLELDSTKKCIADAIVRIEYFITLLNTENTEGTKKYFAADASGSDSTG